MEFFAKLTYFYLFSLALYSSYMCVRIGRRSDTLKLNLHPILYALHLLIFGLSFVQLYQLMALIIAPLAEPWWVPLICKQSSLLTYIAILHFIYWRIEDTCQESSEHCTCSIYI